MAENFLKILPNKKNITRRIIFIAAFLFVEFLIINHLIINRQGTKGVILLCFLIILLTCVLLPVLLSLFRISRIYIDKQSQIISFITPFVTQKYSIHNITGFFTTTYRNRKRIFMGIILKLDNNTVIELAGQNLLNVKELNNYLLESGVLYMGEKTSFFPFRRPS